MRLIFENNDVSCFYKEKGEHTLDSANSQKSDIMCLYRLDCCTSGLVVFAKSAVVFEKIKALQKEDKIVKTYVAKVENSQKLSEFHFPYTIETFFRPYGEGRIKVMPVCLSDIKKYRNKDLTKHSYVSKITSLDDDIATVEITRGFRHQIRSHLAFLGCPICGDTLYGYRGNSDVRPLAIELVCKKIVIPNILEYSL